MIAHVSIPSDNPRQTASVLAAIIDGLVFDFPVVPGAWIAVARDGSGVAIEVYPIAMAHHPGEGDPDPAASPAGPTTAPWEDQILPESGSPRASGWHVALTSRLGEGEILARARAAGWRALRCDRAGVFRLIELWVDNRFLVEVLTGQEIERYRAFLRPEGCREMFGPGVEPDPAPES